MESSLKVVKEKSIDENNINSIIEEAAKDFKKWMEEWEKKYKCVLLPTIEISTLGTVPKFTIHYTGDNIIKTN